MTSLRNSGGCAASAKPYPRAIIFGKRTRLGRENAHLHAPATWRTLCDVRGSANARRRYIHTLGNPHWTTKREISLASTSSRRTRLSANKLTCITLRARYTRVHISELDRWIRICGTCRKKGGVVAAPKSVTKKIKSPKENARTLSPLI